MWHRENFKGKLTPDVNLASQTWFRAGGAAAYLFEPADRGDIELFLRTYPSDEPLYVLGAGSNTLVRDGGYKGVVIKMPFKEIKIEGDRLTAGAGALAQQVALAALDANLSGFEFMRGIPGTIGGCVAMNAGAHESDTAAVFHQAQAYNRAGEQKTLSHSQMNFAYRQATADHLFTHATFQGSPAAPDTIKAKMDEAQASRRAAQPAGARTSGSTFKNPQGHKAWQLIDQAGCRTFTEGGAQVDDLHCNFLVNRQQATATDIERLGEKIRAAVKAKSTIELEWEIKRIGEKQ